MNLTKHREFFNPDEFYEEVHIIGCGAVGSTIAEQLTRLGIRKLHLYDFDIVSEHNITNQMFLHKHIGTPKIDALKEICLSINPDIDIKTYPKGWEKGMNISGHIFIAVDNIDTRKEIIKDNRYNKNITAMYDTRMRLTDAQHFAAFWNTPEIDFLLETMNFTREEAAAATPTSACGTTLSVTPTVRLICSLAVVNFLNAVLNRNITKTILLEAFRPTILAFNKDGLIE